MKESRVNWEQVRIRLRASEAALEDVLSESPERIEAAYRRRAVRLANRKPEYKPVSTGLPVLIFWLAQERHAIELKEVAEVLPFAGCTPVPGSPPRFLGVINLRGELRAVLDLSRLLGCSESMNRDSGFVLVLRRTGREIGVKVDSIEELREIRTEELTPPVPGSYVRRLASETLVLLDMDQVLAGAFSKEGV